MTREEIEQRVNATLSELFEVEVAEITPSARLVDDLGLDSIDAIDLAVKIREQTGRSLEEDELRGLVSVQDVYDLLVEIQSSTEPSAPPKSLSAE